MVVVDLCRLGDAVQQLVVRHSGIEGKILAYHLENKTQFASHAVDVPHTEQIDRRTLNSTFGGKKPPKNSDSKPYAMNPGGR